jgi:cell division protein FtsB
LVKNKEISCAIIFGAIVIIVAGFVLTSISISQQLAQQVNLQAGRQQQQSELRGEQAHLRISPRWLT